MAAQNGKFGTVVAESSRKKMTTDEFFAWQERQDRNYELVDGVPVLTVKAMTGATDRHDRITVNAIGQSKMHPD